MVISQLSALVLSAFASAADVPFRELDFAAACTAAQSESKVVFVDFFTTWCGPCKRLDQVTWKDERVKTWLAEETVPLKIDAEAEVELAERYAIQVYPTLLFLAADGKELGRITGYRDADAFLSEAPDALAGIRPSQRIAEMLAAAPDDPGLRLDLGRALAREGEHERALSEFLWCYDVGMQRVPSFAGVRNSYLVADIAQLGTRYPPALQALRDRAAALRARLIAGNADGASDFAALESALGSAAEVLALWDELVQRELLSPAVRAALFEVVFDQLLAAGRYADVVAGAGDPLERLAGRVRMYELTKQQMPEEESLHAYVRKTVLDDTAKIWRALVATSDPRADELAERLLAFDSSADAYAELCGAALLVRREDVAAALEARGLAALDEEGRADLARTCGRLRRKFERDQGER